MMANTLAIVTIEESSELINCSLADYMEEWGHVSLHIVEQTNNGWTCGYDAYG
jgi:hypothetical protein